jgi:hypothetical protein
MMQKCNKGGQNASRIGQSPRHNGLHRGKSREFGEYRCHTCGDTWQAVGVHAPRLID